MSSSDDLDDPALVAEVHGRPLVVSLSDESLPPIRSSTASGSVFIYQLIMGLAITNAAGLFFMSTDQSGSPQLRPVSSFGLLETALFALLILFAAIRIIEYTLAMTFNAQELYPRVGGAFLFLFDTLLGMVEGIFFYLMSLTVAQSQTEKAPFFYFVGAVVAVDILSDLFGLLFASSVYLRNRTFMIRFAIRVLVFVAGVAIMLYGGSYSVTSFACLTFLYIILDYFLASGLRAFGRRKLKLKWTPLSRK